MCEVGSIEGTTQVEPLLRPGILYEAGKERIAGRLLHLFNASCVLTSRSCVSSVDQSARMLKR
jgi:hypothetical protein